MTLNLTIGEEANLNAWKLATSCLEFRVTLLRSAGNMR
ncbi:unnamed protein product [Acanthoscelides obtectus]|uniref:Uncharacterized protein n=1 Tax=Acanthoscelides obtectus TaxID=200917 RepID=A0A9P0PU75_ACAOB|nr:unnamed protein product [Acanthoscelides obtectus]CAK1667077.1 hypothetical protein AOBTE_LOCUS25666 [Acanthoscelides obtectus]